MKNKKIHSLQILRFFCQTLVILAHSGYFQFLSQMAVSTFFVLSGFVLMYSYQNREMAISVKSLFSFSWSKIKKLYFLNIFVVTSILFIELYALYRGKSEYNLVTIFQIYFSQIFLVQTFTPGVKKIDFLNSPSWYSSVSMMLLFFFPIIKEQVVRTKKQKSCIEYIVILYVIKFSLTYLFSDIEDPVYLLYFSPYFRFFDFTVGCFLFIIYKNAIGNDNCLRYVVIISVILLLFVVVINCNLTVVYWMYYSIQYIPASVFLVLAVALLDQKINKNSLLTRKLVSLGDVSGYAYIIHAMVIEYLKQLYSHFFKEEINGILLFTIAIILTYALSYFYKKMISKTKKKK